MQQTRRTVFDMDRSIIELFRDPRLSYEAASALLDEFIDPAERVLLCEALEKWETAHLVDEMNCPHGDDVRWCATCEEIRRAARTYTE